MYCFWVLTDYLASDITIYQPPGVYFQFFQLTSIEFRKLKLAAIEVLYQILLEVHRNTSHPLYVFILYKGIFECDFERLWLIWLILISAFSSRTDNNAIYWKNDNDIIFGTFRISEFYSRRVKLIFVAHVKEWRATVN